MLFRAILLNRLLRMRINGQFSFPVKLVIQNLTFPFAISYWITLLVFWENLCVFGAKNSFRNAKYSKFGGLVWECVHTLVESSKRQILGRFRAF